MTYRNHAEEIAAARAEAEADDWTGFHASGVPTDAGYTPLPHVEDDSDGAIRMLAIVMLATAAVGLALIGWAVWAVL